MKNTNLLNSQVASTDKYGNDFYFSTPRLRVKCKKIVFAMLLPPWTKRAERKFVVKCETTDNHGMMNEWWVFCALPWSLILIKRFLVLQNPFYQRNEILLALAFCTVCGDSNFSAGTNELVPKRLPNIFSCKLTRRLALEWIQLHPLGPRYAQGLFVMSMINWWTHRGCNQVWCLLHPSHHWLDSFKNHSESNFHVWRATNERMSAT